MNNNETHFHRPIILFFILSLVFITLIALPGILVNYGIIELEIRFIPIAILGSCSPNLANKIVEHSAIIFTAFITIIIISNGPSILSGIKGDLPNN